MTPTEDAADSGPPGVRQTLDALRRLYDDHSDPRRPRLGDASLKLLNALHQAEVAITSWPESVDEREHRLLLSLLDATSSYSAYLFGIEDENGREVAAKNLSHLAEEIDRVAGDYFAAAQSRLTSLTSGEIRSAEAAKVAAVVEQYGAEAVRERRFMLTFYLLGAVLVASSLGALAWGLISANDQNTVTLPVLGAYGIWSGVALLLGIFAWWQAERHRRCANESVRMQLQLATVEPYMLTMSSEIADVAKASLIPRLFPRILEDRDPLKEPMWPSASDLVDALKSRQESQSKDRSG